MYKFKYIRRGITILNATDRTYITEGIEPLLQRQGFEKVALHHWKNPATGEEASFELVTTDIYAGVHSAASADGHAA